MAEKDDFDRDDAADDLLKAAFASYKTEAADAFARTGSPALFGEAKKHARRRAITLGAAVTGCFTLLLGGVAVATNSSYFPGPSANQHGDTNDDTKNPGDPDGPDGLQVSESAVPSPAPVTDLRNTELTLPAWPGALASACPAGVFRFADGVALPPVPPASPSGTASADPSSGTAAQPPAASSWRVLPGPAVAVRANVDGKPGDELLLPVGCGATPVQGLVVLSDQKTPIGFVSSGVDAKDVLAAVAVHDGVIAVTTKTGGVATTRHFRFAGGAFAEVPAPNTSPSGSPSASSSPSSPPPSPAAPGGDTGGQVPEGLNGTQAGA
ncbi:hypothetical protein Afil01_55770 [Actinorhabdospora filicis]|uniref:Uncharacterized protein n=1 Tax=Actinorhabdospora filicis TaxID=1785913 RepID=A0A9W6SPU6_9ACTN|nr:hypothetical protein [Actinorhabdospora filicis]GLZ80770.1 hypothetical protein Afil01_55770 [Actinorhabdospora filicis]